MPEDANDMIDDAIVALVERGKKHRHEAYRIMGAEGSTAMVHAVLALDSTLRAILATINKEA
jgi:hypothetical protein